ncbi:uncharacterized protein LOC120106985 [Phoenix dactylifera]|uniref:Uncharacterized protein LOC120106985 n=1 Tax=Phoenix dactylifera TaxID=42345 RepID=A0A8B8ZWZ0_PHODC|nr:uncharacterized protein LOC120106985 [Phoenix dactylifera]
MKVLLWNCRGAGKPSFAPTCRRFVQQNRPDICILFETHLSGRGLQKARRVLPRSWGFYAVESRGLSGGIIVTWRLESCRLDTFHVCAQEVIMVISEGTNDPWVLAAVYASTDFRERRWLWEEASQLVDQGYSLLMAGDFNCIIDPQEKMRGKPFSHERKGLARVWERLDRACATVGWVQRFSDHRVSHLPRIAFDHCPLLLSTDAFVPVHPPFRFEKMWLSYPRSWEMVREAWSIPVRGDAMYRVSRRLELARRRLRRWNREEVGDIFRRIEESEVAIVRLQDQEVRGGGLSDEDVGELRSLLALNDCLLRQQEIFWRQKARVQ